MGELIERQSQKIVPYTQEQMFNLVADVEAYPQFLPWCTALRVVERSVDRETETILSDMVVSYKVFREKFRSRVFLDRERFEIFARYENGPFHDLKTKWKFLEQDGAACLIDFSIQFEFKNVLMQAAARQIFEKAFTRMSDAFVERAKTVYGPAPSNAERVSP